MDIAKEGRTVDTLVCGCAGQPNPAVTDVRQIVFFFQSQTLHTPPTCIVRKYSKSRCRRKPRSQPFPRQPAHNKQEGGEQECSAAAVVPGFRDRRDGIV
jgi:hypothetical protein